MKKQTSLMTLGLMLATPALAGGAGAPAAQPAPAACRTIAQIVTADPNFSTLATAIDAAGLTETLVSGEYTVFAPTNAAFAKLPSDTLAAALNDADMLRAILLYHVVPGKVAAKDVMVSTSINTVQGSSTLVTVTGNKVMVDNATVTRADLLACNGIIHVVDTVLMPAFDTEEPMAEAPAAEEPVAEEPMAEEPMAEEPMAEEPVAEAPVAEQPAAPAAISILTIPALPASGSAAGATTTVTTETATTEVTTTEVTTEATTETTEVTTETTAEATTETTTETTATEETVAVEETVVADGNTLYDAIVSDEQFSTFRDLLSDAGLTEVLMDNEYTVFAPTNAAFEAFDQDKLALIVSDPVVLQDFLLYYIVTGKANDAMLAQAQLSTLQGSSLDLKMDGGALMVNTAASAARIDSANNGVIIPISQVLVAPNLKIPEPPAPPAATEPAATEPAATTTTATATTTTATTTTTVTAGTVVELLQGQAQFSTLLSLIQRAGLAETLTAGDFTIFAPTNDAFAKVPQATLDLLMADNAKLRQILTFHVVSGRVANDGLNVAQLRSVEGSSIDLKMDGTTLRVGTLAGDVLNGGAVTVTPLTAGNSIIYPVDAVLIPASFK